ncbi:MAG: nucleoside diphosphate kinase regulator [Kiritimatiellae bacterium]|nr:nucleoside diphosphate kinase regulator [Kiritimatiellia bacterium]
MTKRKLYITELDKQRLDDLIEKAREFGTQKSKDLDALAAELERAEVVSQKEIPPDIITMNSQVSLRDLSTNETTTYTLVFPDESNVDENKISVLAPIGTAILGYAQGDIIEWQVPAGLRKLKVNEILYQPESSGDLHL